MNTEDACKLIGWIYDASQDAGQWPDLLCSFADACHMENAALVVVDPETSFSSVLSPRSDPDVAVAYNDCWWQHDPTAETARKSPAGQITTLADTGRDTFMASAFYNDFWRHSGLGADRLAASLFTRGNAFSSLVLQPSTHRDFISDEAYQTAAFLVPHVAKAIAISRRFHHLELQRIVLEQSRQPDHAGSIVVDQDGFCLHADGASEDLMRSGSVFKLENGVVRLCDDKADLRCRTVLRSLATSSLALYSTKPIPLERPSGQPPLELEILPCRAESHNPVGRRAVAKLIFQHREISLSARRQGLQQRFGLTPTEAALTLEMLKGDGRSAAAGRCGISINTARTHLTRIFEKVGVKRQAELVRVVLDCEL